jgi:hypothetical protein
LKVMTATTVQIPVSITVLVEVIRSLGAEEKVLLKRLLDEEVAALQQVSQSSHSNYPLRQLPLVIAEDFDEPMLEMWEALGE